MEWEWKYHKHFVLALYTKQNEIETEGDCNDDDDDDDDDDEDSDIMALFTGISRRSDSVLTKKIHYPGGRDGPLGLWAHQCKGQRRRLQIQ